MHIWQHSHAGLIVVTIKKFSSGTVYFNWIKLTDLNQASAHDACLQHFIVYFNNPLFIQIPAQRIGFCWMAHQSMYGCSPRPTWCLSGWGPSTCVIASRTPWRHSWSSTTWAACYYLVTCSWRCEFQLREHGCCQHNRNFVYDGGQYKKIKS